MESLKKVLNELIKINEKTGCHELHMMLDKDGYARICAIGKTWKAHRFAYELYHGKSADGWLVCHKCDNPKCINPEHLFLGTAADNSADMVKKGRQSKIKRPDLIGENNPAAKLNRQIVNEMRKLKETTDISTQELSWKFKTSLTNVKRILNKEIWK